MAKVIIFFELMFILSVYRSRYGNTTNGHITANAHKHATKKNLKHLPEKKEFRNFARRKNRLQI